MDKVNALAEEILNSAVKSLSGEFIYFAYALGKMNIGLSSEVKKIVTNGKSTFVDPIYVLSQTAENGTKGISASMLHVMLHQLFTHPFKKVEDLVKFDLASDIVVGYALDGLGYPHGTKSDVAKRKSVYKSIIDVFGGVNDKTANDFCLNLNQNAIKEYASVFTVCDHSAWAFREREEGSEEGVNMPIPSGEMDEEEIEDLSAEWASLARNLIPQLGKLNLELKKMISVGLGIEKDYKTFLRAFLRSSVAFALTSMSSKA